MDRVHCLNDYGTESRHGGAQLVVLVGYHLLEVLDFLSHCCGLGYQPLVDLGLVAWDLLGSL